MIISSTKALKDGLSVLALQSLSTRCSGEGDFSPVDLYLLPSLFPFRLRLPDRYDADCVSLTASAGLVLQGAPLTRPQLCLPISSMWTTDTRKAEKERSQSEEGTLERGSMEGCWLRTSRCRVLIWLCPQPWPQTGKKWGRPHRKWNLIKMH